MYKEQFIVTEVLKNIYVIFLCTAAVKLLLDMGSDINAQIETNRNTALTLACFQGRHEVVSLLLDRKANVEHRAKVIYLTFKRCM